MAVVPTCNEVEWENVRLLERPGKLGLGSAYRAVFARAAQEGAEIVAQIDADLSKLSGFIVREAPMLVGLWWLEDRRDRLSRRRLSG